MKQAAKRLQPQLVRWRRDLHRIPEVGLSLPRTAEYVERELKGMGLEPKRIGDGLVVNLPCSGGAAANNGRIAFRADMDALPIAELNEADYKSQNPGVMHACGHDAHMAIALGTANHFTQEKPAVPIRIIFQPGEEGYGGAGTMIEGGALNGVEAIFALHVGDLFGLPPRKVAVRYGAMMAASDGFNVRFRGRGTHAASPHRGSDPIIAAAQFVNAVQALRAREINPSHPCIISICSVHGGTTHNVIPECVEMLGTLRTVEEFDRDYLHKRLKGIAESVTSQGNLEAEFTWAEASYPILRNHDPAVRLVEEAARSTLGDSEVCRVEYPSLGGEDMALYLQRVSGCLWSFPALNPDKGISAPNHNPHFDVDDDLLWIPLLVNIKTAHLHAGAKP